MATQNKWIFVSQFRVQPRLFHLSFSLFSTFPTVFLFLIVITVVFLRFVDVASNSVCEIFSTLLFFIFFKLQLSLYHRGGIAAATTPFMVSGFFDNDYWLNAIQYTISRLPS